MTQPNKKARVLIGVRGMEQESGVRISAALLAMPGVTQAQPDQGQIAVQYDPTALTVMDLLRAIRKQGFLAGML
ncbi:heavy-metal-associated domain-containing protein [Deinococcus psychrotolerans]|uniref:Heavy-metal-associated domain-containing protein n=1 Tax=Deinococcus psychrotolerans TaxID=2489213 RepID=A0A3G8YCI4_9DEIO|nr:heavy-metal-associated domain-containing protein [Deinococcus psychrotolerans]AZI42705.1 heavy-metal-associated domain-containing protein [Deinococcus psychrotolerans]